MNVHNVMKKAVLHAFKDTNFNKQPAYHHLYANSVSLVHPSMYS